MIVDVTLPQLGETADEAEILAWLKEPGEAVARGEPLLEVHTDKIAVEVPALEAGVLREILAEPGQTVAVGAPVARLERSGSDASPDAPADGRDDARPSETDRAAASAAPDEAEGGGASGFEPAPPPDDPADPRRGRVRASPSARRRARELGVALADVDGSGPNGRVTTNDVERAASAESPATASPDSAPPASEPAAPGAPEPEAAPGVHELTRIERATARSTAAAFAAMPHFYVSVRAEATELARRVEREDGVSLNDALVLAAARTLREHRRLNATYEAGAGDAGSGGERLTLHERIDVGVITATPAGVVTSVVRGADRLDLRAIHRRVREVRARAAAGRAGADDLQGATFCISNLGMYDVEAFSAILPPANSAILAVGALREEALVERGALRFGRTLSLTVSADHRALDGVAVALFLTALRARLREPHSLFDAAPVGGSP